MFQLTQLPYSYDALEPFIDAKTMEIHHTKHHQTYVDKLNAAVSGTEWENMTVEELLRNIDKVPEEKKQAVKNHGGGHANHSHFWLTLGKEGSKEPVGKVKDEIEKVWGSVEKFKEEFVSSATTLFGSGWTWLAADENGTGFHIHNLPMQENPLMHGHKPVLGLDVWEHAYYLKYQNRRPEYIEAFWNVIDWDKVEELFVK